MSILTAPSALKVPDCWRTVKFGVCVPDQSTECGSIGCVMGVEHLHVHAREIARVLAHMRGDLGFRDRRRHGPGRVEIDAGDLGGQRRRRLFGLADDDAIAPHHLVVLDRFGKGRGDVDHDIALAEREIHVAETLERSLELLDALLHGDVERGQRARRHRSGRRQAMAHLEALDAPRPPPRRKAPVALSAARSPLIDQALAQEIVMRRPARRSRIWRRTGSPASRRAPRCRNSSARLP